MANLKDIRKRINTVKSTQKITSAMKLVSASYFAKAVQAVQKARPYNRTFNHMVSNLLSSNREELKSPLLKKVEEKRSLLVMIGTDRGLCGGLNSNNHKNVVVFLKSKESAGVEMDIFTWGRKPTVFSKKLKNKSVGKLEKVLEKPNYDITVGLCKGLVDRFVKREYDRIYLAYPKFKSAMDQMPTISQFLPIEPEKIDAVEGVTGRDYIIEPKLNDMIDMLFSRKLYGDLFMVFLEGAASEHGARMTAMDSATNNAIEVSRKLTIKYNRARQAAITTELTEIVSGAEALS
ncbi:MAG: ATP synthase F1 subunit gamma [Oligoflexales bacterium]|nr:ATP synthase F1 subunit gamma [Oligoflexales bacterium]